MSPGPLQRARRKMQKSQKAGKKKKQKNVLLRVVDDLPRSQSVALRDLERASA